MAGRACLFFILVFCFGTATGQILDYDCRRYPSGQGCANGGTCSQAGDGCTCATDYSRHNCKLLTSTIDADSCTAGPCENNAVCTSSGGCFCNYDSYGDRCQHFRATVWCTTEKMFININPDFSPQLGGLFVESYEADAPSLRTVEECNLLNNNISALDPLPTYVLDVNQQTPQNLEGYYIELPHAAAEGAQPLSCLDAHKQEVRDTDDNLVRTEYTRRIKVLFNAEIMNTLDQIINANCSVSNDADITTYASVSSVSVNIKDQDYAQVNISDAVEPILFELKDESGNTITSDLSLGDVLDLKFSLLSSDYQKIKVLSCRATNGEDGHAGVDFFVDNCPAPNWLMLFRQYQLESEGTVTLRLSAFRFSGESNTVVFVCNVRLCTSTDITQCDRNPACPSPSDSTSDGTGDSTSGGTGDSTSGGTGDSTSGGTGDSTGGTTRRRRKRSSGQNEETQLQQKVTIRAGRPSPQGVVETKDSQEDCMQHSEVVIIIVTFTVAFALLLVLCVVLVIRLLRSRQKVVDASDVTSADSQSHYTLPRLSAVNF